MRKTAKITDRIATGVLYATAIFFMVLLCAIIGYIIYQGVIALKPWSLGIGPNGVGAQLFNTIYLVMLSLIVTVPAGIFAGIYLSQYAKQGKLTAVIRTCVETLSSLPSIVVGLFGFFVFIILTHSQWNLLAGALSLAILNIPLMTRVTEDAFTSIPIKFRDGSLATGATKWQTIIHVLFPIAIPQIITGVILAAGRGFGEAAVLIYTAGMGSDINWSNWNPLIANTPFNIFRPADTLAVHIWSLKTQSINPDAVGLANVSAMVLIIVVIVFSIGCRILGKKLKKRKLGE